MPANPNGNSAEPQTNKNTEDINNGKNKKNTSNEEQISEKKEEKNDKSWGDCPLTDHQKSIQI